MTSIELLKIIQNDKSIKRWFNKIEVPSHKGNPVNFVVLSRPTKMLTDDIISDDYKVVGTTVVKHIEQLIQMDGLVEMTSISGRGEGILKLTKLDINPILVKDHK